MCHPDLTSRPPWLHPGPQNSRWAKLRCLVQVDPMLDRGPSSKIHRNYRLLQPNKRARNCSLLRPNRCSFWQTTLPRRNRAQAHRIRYRLINLHPRANEIPRPLSHPLRRPRHDLIRIRGLRPIFRPLNGPEQLYTPIPNATKVEAHADPSNQPKLPRQAAYRERCRSQGQVQSATQEGGLSEVLLDTQTGRTGAHEGQS